MRQKVLQIEDAAKVNFLEREEEVRGLSLAALSGHHLFFVGPPGTAKTMMIRWYADHLEGANFFYWLLTRFSTPEEVFGPVDLGALKVGAYRRITGGKLPEAEVAFLDEVFKSNSAILNSILSVLQERVYHNDGTPQACPLIFCAGASNELPEEDEALEALYDRFLLRYHVGYLKERARFMELLQRAGSPAPAPVITQEELTRAQAEVAAMRITHDAEEGLADLRDHLRKEGIVVSDRRFVQGLDVLRAEAWLRDLGAVEPDCIEVCSHIMWDRPDDARKVRGLCLQVSDPNIFRAQQILEAAEEAAARVLDGDATTEEAIQISAQLKKLATDLDSLKGARITSMAAKVRALNKEVVRRGVGLDV